MNPSYLRRGPEVPVKAKPVTIVALYNRLSQEESKKKVEPGTYERIQKSLQEFLTIFKQRGVQWVGPAIEKIKDTSIVEQIRVNLALARKEGWKVHACVVDYDVSGASYERIGFNHIIEWAKTKVITLVVIKDLDRLARDVVFQEINWAEFKEMGCWFRFVYGNEQAQDDFLRSMMGVINQHKVQKGRQDAEQRIDYCIEYKLPYVDPPWGYKWNQERDNWIPDKKDFLKVFELFHDFMKDVPVKDTCKRLEIGTTKYYDTLHKARSYAGYVMYRQRKKTGFKKLKDGFIWKWYQGSHHPLLSQKFLRAFLEKRNQAF